MRKSNKLPLTGLAVSLLTVVLSVPASAHVVVKPNEALTAAFQTFTVGAPNEKGIPTTAVKLNVPAGLQHVTPTVKPGWKIDVEKEGEGKTAVVKSITWSDGEVPIGFREEFTFSAKLPDNATELQWKAYQTYSDGQVVAWDLTEDKQPKKTDGSPDFSKSGPFSVTKVAAESEQATATKKADQAAADAKKAASRAQTIGVVGVVLGLGGIALTTRKKK